MAWNGDTWEDDYTGSDPNQDGDPNYATTEAPAPSPEPAAQPEPGGGGGSDSGSHSLKDQLGDLWTPGADEEWARRDYNPDYGQRIVNKENLRANNEVSSEYHENGAGGYLTGPKQPKSALLPMGKGLNYGDSGGGNSHYGDLWNTLSGLFPGGAFNQDIVNRRTDNARAQLEAQKRSTQKNNEAYLAEHGLAGSGPQAEAANSLDSRLFESFGNAMNNIYANESENADKRMMTALQAATGMTEAQAQQAIDQFRANTERTLGEGNLALGNKNSDQSYLLGQGNLALGNTEAANRFNLGGGQLALQQQQLAEAIRAGKVDEALRLMALIQAGATQSSNGYINGD